MLKEFNAGIRKKWLIKCSADAENRKLKLRLSAELGIEPLVAQLLINRGYRDAKSAGEFLRMEKEMLCNPFDMKDMDKAVERIKRAVDGKERITVYGDYDVDGVTSVCTLCLYLRSKGASVDYYIPNRTGEGYGVSCQALEAVAGEGTSLVITVDTGITAFEEVEYAKGLGIDFVITDHHECQSEIPSAVAVVNPHRHDCPYPFKELAGVGVVFKLISAYEERNGTGNKIDAITKICDEYADLIAIGTIADVMPIREENKLIVSYGLASIENTNRVGLSALIEAASAKIGEGGVVVTSAKPRQKPKITSGFVGYTLAPRINAAGRMDSASLAADLFLTNDKKKATELAFKLCEANRERQSQENSITKEAYDKIPIEYDPEKYPVIVLDSNDWHHGVIGIVSSRITEKFGLPSILVSFDGNDKDVILDTDVGKGSGRSVKGLNIVEALDTCSDLLVKFGGHELAAGLSVTRANLPAFREKINEYARNVLSGQLFEPTVEADMEIEPSDVNIQTVEQIGLLEPFGTENPMPVFVMRDLQITEITPISAGKHTRLTLKKDNKYFTAMYFGHSASALGFCTNELIDVLFNLDINEWYGKKSVQMLVKDIQPSKSEEEKIEREKERYSEIENGAEYLESENILPARNDFAAVYNYIKHNSQTGDVVLTHKLLLLGLQAQGSDINYIKLKFIIKIFKELNLLGINEADDEIYEFKLKFHQNKTELDKSNLLRKLRSQQKSG